MIWFKPPLRPLHYRRTHAVLLVLWVGFRGVPWLVQKLDRPAVQTASETRTPSAEAIMTA